MRARQVRHASFLGSALFAALVVAGAAGAQSQPKFPTELPVPKTGTAPAASEAPPAPAAPAASPNTPEGARDPFEPLIRRPAPGSGPGEERALEISGLRLVGIIWDARDPAQIRALVETADGLGYYLRANEEKFGGTVVAIGRDRIRFSVREQAPGGPVRTRTVELRLNKPDGQ
jgi:hypothetical protein